MLVINVATNGLDVVLGTRNHVGFYGLNIIAIVLGAITLGVQLRERAEGTGSSAAVIAFAVLLLGLTASWIVVAKLMS